MECNKRNSNTRYAIFRDSNFKCFAKSNGIIFMFFCDRFSKLKKAFSVFGPIIFYIFGKFVKTKCHTFLRMTLKCFNRIQITLRCHEEFK